MIENSLLSMDDGVSKIVEADATDVAKEYYTSYSKYVLEHRALPSVYDGLKPVQRRTIHIANQQPKKLMKTAKLAGMIMALHPHGDASIVGAINDMAHPLNALPLFNTKGNFGGVGFGASAARYTECYLSEVARMNFCQFIDYADYEVGEIGELEPKALPSLIPYALIRGSEGIGIGLSTKVMPLNLIGTIDYFIDFIKTDGHPRKTVKPDVGYVLIENDDVSSQVQNHQGKITTSSIVTQVSDSVVVIEGLAGKNIDAVLNKMDKYDHFLSDGKVGYRDASTATMKYVFEIYDNSITPERLRSSLEWCTRCNSSFTRVMEEDGSAVYARLDYVVQKSLECLNRAIDKKIEVELARSKSQLTLYEVLRKCKDLGVFNDVAKMTTDELILLIVRSTDCSEEVAREVVKKPISYLTRSHDAEEKNLKSQISDLESHDRKKYLLSLYKEFRRAVMPIYESKKHSITKDEVISNPCVKMTNGVIQITDGDGSPFSSTVYFVSDKGYVYRRSLSTLSKSDIFVETDHGDKIIGFATDKSKYLEVVTKFCYPGWEGRIIVDLSTLTYDKKIVNLREEESQQEVISYVGGLSRLSKDKETAVKTKLSKTNYFQV